MTVLEARARAVERLTRADASGSARFGTPGLDADLLLCHRLGVSRSYLLAHRETELGDAESAFWADVERRAGGIPVAYLVGSKEFWGLSFSVSPAVLIPKPDTETLVELAVTRLAERDGNPSAPPRVLDACTGSGCVAVSIAHSRQDARLTATDISGEALAVARLNADALVGPNRVTFLQGDLWDGLPSIAGGWDLIVSNPPYVPTETAEALLSDGRGEPRLALDGGADGLDLVRQLASVALTSLAPSGILLVETGEYNAAEAAAYFERLGYCDIVVHKDLEGQDRVVEGRKNDDR